MTPLAGVFIFALGAAIGSFLNVCIHRMPREESIVSPPSHCPRCRTPIKPYDNIPLLSYLALRGRCRSCGEPISPRYVLVELLTALAFLGLSYAFAPSLPMIAVSAVFAASLIVVVFVDMEHQIIPDEISIGGMVFAVLASVAVPSLHGTDAWRTALIRSLAGLATGGGLFWLIRIVGGRVFKKEAMGFGDVKLMAYIGALLGPALALFTTFLASLIGSVVGVGFIAGGRAQLTSRLPFGPFICIGAILSMLFGSHCIDWYLGLIH